LVSKLRPGCGIWLDFDSDGRRHGKSGCWVQSYYWVGCVCSMARSAKSSRFVMP
jgi:hypothetical protein